MVAVLSPTASAQQAAKEVTITDQDGAPIALAEVKLLSGGQSVDLLTDDAGRIAVDPAPLNGVDVIHLDVSAVGYEPASVDMQTQDTTSSIIQLKPLATDSGDIIVVGRRISRPFSPQTLGFLDVVTDPKAQADPILAVNNLPASTNVTGNARITFRGNRASINRAYLNDVPVYEFSAGSEVDNSTQNRSVFGLIVADEVETYPGNPPTYLSGATGGVVRVLTPDTKPSGSTVSITDLGISGGHSFASKAEDNFFAVYGSLTDFTLHNAINPGLDKLYGTIRSASGGGLAHLTTRGGGTVNIFLQREVADDAFPFTVYGIDSMFRLKPVKQRSVVSAALPIGDMVLSANAAFTHSTISEAFGRSRVHSTNAYGFGSLDLARGSSRDNLSVRVGVDGEYVRQVSGTALVFDENVVSTSAFRSALRQLTGYVFATYRESERLMFSAGARRTIASNIGQSFSMQASATLSSSDLRHKLIVSIGKYGGVAVPTRAYYGPVSRSTNRQVEADYSWHFANNVIGLSGYLSEERSEGAPFDSQYLRISSSIDNLTGIARSTRSRGLEAYATWLPTKGLDARLSFATVSQSMRLGGQRVRGSNDYPGILRASVKYATPGTSTYSLSLTHRSGEPFTRAEGVVTPFGSPSPVYGPVNAARLPAYLSLDASISRRVRIRSVPGNPLIFAMLNNFANHRNASSQILTLPGDAIAYRNLAGRTVVFGLTTSF